MSVFSHRPLILLPLMAAVAMTGCTTTRSTGQIEKVSAPGCPNVAYRIVKNVDSKGSSVAICPASPILFGSLDDAVVRANEDAVGKAIFEDNSIDVVLAPKTRVETTSILGIVGFANVQLKGKGAEITGPK